MQFVADASITCFARHLPPSTPRLHEHSMLRWTTRIQQGRVIGRGPLRWTTQRVFFPYVRCMRSCAFDRVGPLCGPRKLEDGLDRPDPHGRVHTASAVGARPMGRLTIFHLRQRRLGWHSGSAHVLSAATHNRSGHSATLGRSRYSWTIRPKVLDRTRPLDRARPAGVVWIARNGFSGDFFRAENSKKVTTKRFKKRRKTYGR